MAWNWLMTQDLISALLIGICSLCCFGFERITDHNNREWMNLPLHVRAGIFGCGCVFMIRSINFIYIRNDSQTLGHLNGWAMMALVALTYTLSTGLLYAARKTFPSRVWKCIDYIMDLAKCSRNKRTGLALVELAMNGNVVVPPDGETQDFVRSMNIKYSEGMTGLEDILK